jgi:hypothetical protein
VALDGLDEPPSGEVFLVFRRKPRLMDLVRSPDAPGMERTHVEPVV